jgi:hypothetical protein
VEGSVSMEAAPERARGGLPLRRGRRNAEQLAMTQAFMSSREELWAVGKTGESRRSEFTGDRPWRVRWSGGSGGVGREEETCNLK